MNKIKKIWKENWKNYLIACGAVFVLYPGLYVLQYKHIIDANSFLLLIPLTFIGIGLFASMFLLILGGSDGN